MTLFWLHKICDICSGTDTYYNVHNTLLCYPQPRPVKWQSCLKVLNANLISTSFQVYIIQQTINWPSEKKINRLILFREAIWWVSTTAEAFVVKVGDFTVHVHDISTSRTLRANDVICHTNNPRIHTFYMEAQRHYMLYIMRVHIYRFSMYMYVRLYVRVNMVKVVEHSSKTNAYIPSSIPNTSHTPGQASSGKKPNIRRSIPDTRTIILCDTIFRIGSGASHAPRRFRRKSPALYSHAGGCVCMNVYVFGICEQTRSFSAWWGYVVMCVCVSVWQCTVCTYISRDYVVNMVESGGGFRWHACGHLAYNRREIVCIDTHSTQTHSAARYTPYAWRRTRVFVSCWRSHDELEINSSSGDGHAHTHLGWWWWRLAVTTRPTDIGASTHEALMAYSVKSPHSLYVHALEKEQGRLGKCANRVTILNKIGHLLLAGLL